MSILLRRAPPVGHSGPQILIALSLLIVLAHGAPCRSGERAPLQRAIVPADRTTTWPAGDWQRVPSSELLEFERDYASDVIVDVAPPLIDRLVVRGTLTDGAVLTGSFEARTRRFDPRAAFLELGRASSALSAIQWTDRPAIWGSAPDGAVLLYVDRDADVFRGRWTQRGEEVLGGTEFDLRVFPAAAIRIEVTLPNTYELQSSRGVVLPPEVNGADARLWSIELGQQTTSLITVVPRSDRPPIVSLSVERSTAWSIRPDGCRLQADFNISIPASAPATLEFEIPDDLQNPEVTTTSNLSLPAEVDRRSMPPRLVVPLPRLASGRLGIVRISGDLPLRTDDDWRLPDVRLENSTLVSSLRRMHVDRPLKLLALDLHGVRQTDVNIDDSGGDWTFEDTSPESHIDVRIGRPPALLTLGAVTLIEPGSAETRFRTAVELLSSSGGDYRAELRLPAGWNVIDVGSPSGDRGTVTAWRTIDTDQGVQLELEFRQSLSSQSPRRVVIRGRRIGGPVSTGQIELFPTLTSPGQARIWIGLERNGPASGALTPLGGARAFDAANATPEWNRLVAALGVADSNGQWSWFTQSDGQSAGTIVWGPTRTNAFSPESTAVNSPRIASAPVAGRFAMHLLLETETGGPDAPWVRHRAQYLLSGPRPSEPPKIQMPVDAQIDGLSIDGQPQDVVMADETIELLAWPATPRIVEIRYRTRAAGAPHWLSRPLEVTLPTWGVAPQSLEWRLHLPRTERVADVHFPCSSVLPRPDSDWTTRLFGPLGRDNWRLTVNPLSIESWQRRLWPQVQSTESSLGDLAIRTSAPGSAFSIELANLPNVERAGWLSIFAALLITALLRLWSRRGAAILWIAACLLLLGLSLLPYVSATLCGGALTGGLIGMLLPRQWIGATPRTSASPARPSTLARAGAAVGAATFMLSLWHNRLCAQPTPPPPSEQRANAAIEPPPVEFDILIPETAGVPDEFALIRRRLLPLFERWQRTRHRSPAYLVQSAHYALDLTKAPQVHSRFTVAVFDQRPLVPLELPFGHLSVPDPDACRVNGEPAQIRPATSSNAMLIELPGAESDQSPPVRMVEVEVTLQLSANARSGAGWQFIVPAVLDAEVSLSSDAVEQGLKVDSEVEHIDPDGRRLFQLGGRSTVSVGQAASAAAQSTESLTADAVTLVEVHPLRLRVRTQLLLAPPPRSSLPSGLQRLRLVLPEQADVREVAVGGLRGYSVRHLQREITLLELELDRWPAPDSGIHLDFTLPVQRTPEGIMIPPLPLLRDNRVQSHHIGLRGGPGITLEPSPASRLPATLHEVPAEMFSAGLSTDNAWPIPSHVYVATSPAALTVDARPLEPQKSIALEQSVEIGDDALQWQATADIEIALTPAFQYEFELSEAVDLAAVSLIEEGVERLPDWSHIGNQLVIYLPGDRLGKQKVRLTGTMRFDPNVIAPLPVCTLRNARTTSSELYIRSTASRRLELFAADGSPLPPVAGNAAPGTMQFTQQDADLPSAFRALPATDPLLISVVTTFERDRNGWKLLTRVIPARALADWESVQFSLPQELARLATAVPPAIMNRSEERTIRLLPESGAASGNAVPMAFSLPVDVPARGEWTAPHAKFLNVIVSDQFVVIPTGFPLAPAVGAAASVEPADWPMTLLAGVSPPEALSNSAVYRWTGNESNFQNRTSYDDAPDLKLVESTVWQDDQHTSGGETSFWFVATQSRCVARFDWPADTELRSALWDGRPLDPERQVNAQLEFLIDGLSTGSLHRLTVSWSQPRDASNELWRPRWSPETTAPEFATILPREGFILLPRIGEPSRSEVLQFRAETLLTLASEYNDSSATEATTALAREIDLALLSLDRLPQSDWQALRARRAALRLPAGYASVGDPYTTSLQAIAWRDPAALTVQLSNRELGIRFLQLHTGLTTAAAVLAGLLLLAVCLRFRSWITRTADRLPFDPAALRVLTLGALWWTWLKFGGVGLLLVFGAIFVHRQAQNRVRSDAPPAPV